MYEDVNLFVLKPCKWLGRGWAAFFFGQGGVFSSGFFVHGSRACLIF